MILTLDIASTLGQNFISNTDWIVKRDLVNLKNEVNQIKKDLNETISLIRPNENKVENVNNVNIENQLNYNMVSRIKTDESFTQKQSTPLSLDDIRQSNLKNRDTYYRSTTSSTSSTLSSSPSSIQSESLQKEESNKIQSEFTLPKIRLDKTNILLLGPTG